MKRLAALSVAFLTSALCLPAAVPPPDKLLADDTLGVFTIPDYTVGKKAWGQTAALQLWNDPALKPFREKLLNKLRSDVIEPVEKEFGIKLSDYAGVAQGQITFALTRNGWAGQSDAKPGFLLLVDARDKTDTLKSNLADLKKKWVESGKQLRTDKIRDIDFTTLIFSSDELSRTVDKLFPDPNEGWETVGPPKQKKPATKMEWLVGQSDSLFILGDSAKEIEKVLIRQAGGAVPPLAEKPAFAAQFGRLFRDANCYAWIDSKSIVEAITKASKAEAGPQEGPPRRRQGPAPDAVLSALGLSGLQSVTFAEKEIPDGSIYHVQLNVPEANRRGLFKILSFEAREASPLPFVPADAVKFSRFRIDLARGFDTLEQMLVEAVPQIGSVIKMVVDNAGKDKDPNFDMRKQLFANLGDDLISFEKTPRKMTLDSLNSPPSLTLISSPRPQELAAAVRSLSAIMPQQAGKVKEREFLGRTVYSMTLPQMQQGRGGQPPTRLLHYAASGGYVALSTDVAMLEEYLRSNVNPGKPLADTPGLGEAAQKVGGMNTGMFGYENQRETTRAALEILKKESGTLANLFSASPLAGRLGMNENPNALKDWLDFSLLPPFDQMAKYLYFNVWSGSVNAEGITFQIFGPTPPQLKK